MESEKITIKAKHHLDESSVRRVSVPTSISYAELVNTLTDLFASVTKFALTYLDDDNDNITISSDVELQEAIRLSLSMKPPILRITLQSIDSSPTKENAGSTIPAPVQTQTSPVTQPNPMGGIPFQNLLFPLIMNAGQQQGQNANPLGTLISVLTQKPELMQFLPSVLGIMNTKDPQERNAQLQNLLPTLLASPVVQEILPQVLPVISDFACKAAKQEKSGDPMELLTSVLEQFDASGDDDEMYQDEESEKQTFAPSYEEKGSQVMMETEEPKQEESKAEMLKEQPVTVSSVEEKAKEEVASVSTPIAAEPESLPAVVVQEPVSIYEEQLQQLSSMGFTDREKNTSLLLRYAGDIMAAVNDLLN